MKDDLKDKPRLTEDALGLCAFCNKLMLESGMPIFYRFTVQQCGIDRDEVNRHVGLAMAMGGGTPGLALASVLGPGVKPVIELSKGKTNVCAGCVTERLEVAQLAHFAIEEG